MKILGKDTHMNDGISEWHASTCTNYKCTCIVYVLNNKNVPISMCPLVK